MSGKEKTRSLKKGQNQNENRKGPAGSSPTSLHRIWGLVDDLSSSRPSFWFCVFLLPMAVIAYYPSSEPLRTDYDMWFHLTYGKHYVQNLTWHIDHSMYSWTPARADAMYVTWLGSSVIYLVYTIFGVAGLFILNMILLLASGAVIFRFAKTANTYAGLFLLIGVLLVAMTIRPGAHHIKPEMFSIFLTTLLVAFYMRFRMLPGRWIVAAFPVLFLFWVNTHGLWIFGLGFIGIVLGLDLGLYFFARAHSLDRKALLYLSWATGLVCLVLCINPHGPAYPVHTAIEILNPLISSLFPVENIDKISYYRPIIAYQNMWKFVFFFEAASIFNTVSAVCALVMVSSLIVAWMISWKRSGRIDLPVIVSNIAFFFMGMFMARLLLIFPLLWIFSMIFFSWRAGPESLLSRTGPICLAVYLFLVGYAVFAATGIYAAPSWFGARYRDFIPDREVRYIMDHNLPGPIFNNYLAGGYLMWAMYPKYKVFIDPRQFPYSEQVLPDYRGIGTKFPLDDKGLRSFMEKYPARTALINYTQKELILWFQRSPDWVLAYFDKTAAVWVHRDAIPALSPKAMAATHGPGEYKDVDNPVVLGYLFNIYNFFGSRFSGQIIDIYNRNVSDMYIWKKTELSEMNKILERTKTLESE